MFEKALKFWTKVRCDKFWVSLRENLQNFRGNFYTNLWVEADTFEYVSPFWIFLGRFRDLLDGLYDVDEYDLRIVIVDIPVRVR